MSALLTLAVYSAVATLTLTLTKAAFIDLSHAHGPGTIMAPKNPQYQLRVIFEGDFMPGVYAKFGEYSVGEHGGTHVDAPTHFDKDGVGLEGIPISSTIADGVRIDCSEETKTNPVYAVTVDKIRSWESEHGKIPMGAAVIFNFNWSSRFSDPSKYFNTKDLNNTSTYRFPHLTPEAVDFLLDEREIAILATDTPSPDLLNTDMHAHVRLLGDRKLIVENLNNPGLLPARNFRFHATPVKFMGATGVQVRAFGVTYDPHNFGVRVNCDFLVTLLLVITLIGCRQTVGFLTN